VNWLVCWCQFHQRFTCAFFVWKQIEQLFSKYVRLCDFWRQNVVCKTHMQNTYAKRLWNWRLESISSTFYAFVFVGKQIEQLFSKYVWLCDFWHQYFVQKKHAHKMLINVLLAPFSDVFFWQLFGSFLAAFWQLFGSFSLVTNGFVIFGTNILYKKHARKMLMKLTVAGLWRRKRKLYPESASSKIYIEMDRGKPTFFFQLFLSIFLTFYALFLHLSFCLFLH